MCGILLSFPADQNQVRFQRALQSLQHRGPDGEGIYHDAESEISLGHRRLSIIDLSAQAAQPMWSHDHRYAIVFNGEIYNFTELRKELEGKGARFLSQSDTEVILEAYRHWGEAFLLKMNGMWAMAIWDSKEKNLLISRDRFGKKPLFYTYTHEGIVFASEMKALYPYLPEVRPSTHFHWCASHLMSYESTDKCLVEGISRFPAGSVALMSTKNKRVEPRRFWNTRDHLRSVPGCYEEQVEEFKSLFIDACHIRMRSDVPIGTALSGGLDSSATICAMAAIGRQHPGERVSEQWQHAFVASFPGTFLDESLYAHQVTQYLGIPSTLIEIKPDLNPDTLLRQLYLQEELYLTSPSPMMQLYSAVRQSGVRVTLDGHGADELFCGYGEDIYKAFDDAGADFRLIKDLLQTRNGLRAVKGSGLEHDPADWSDYWAFQQKRHGGHLGAMKWIMRSVMGMNPPEQAEKGHWGELNSYLYELVHETILPTLLRNYDRYSMAAGVEIRMPFMDYRLVTFLFSLPWQSKVRKGYTKALVRDALRDIMPESIVNRTSKIGFNTPIVEWMKGPWKEWLLEMVHSKTFEQSSLIQPNATRLKVLEVINRPDVSFLEGEQAWISLSPYLWQSAMNKHASEAIYA